MVGTVRAAVAVGTVMTSLGTASAGSVGVECAGPVRPVSCTDFIVTQPGTAFNFGGLGLPVAPGLVALIGNAAPGNFFDTAVERLAEAIIDEPTAGGPFSDTIPIEFVALSLRSVSPVAGAGPLAGFFFDVFVDLDPGTPSTGFMTINHEFDDQGGPLIDTFLGLQPQTGTWSTIFTLNLIITFEDTANILADVLFPASLELISKPGRWTHGPGGEFLLGNPFIENHSGGLGQHKNMQAVPLPAPVWLGSLGILAVIVFRRRFMFM